MHLNAVKHILLLINSKSFPYYRYTSNHIVLSSEAALELVKNAETDAVAGGLHNKNMK